MGKKIPVLCLDTCNNNRLFPDKYTVKDHT